MSGDPDGSELARVRKERDFLWKLLELGHVDAPQPFLTEALELVASLASAGRGYLELGRALDGLDGPRWWTARGFSEDEVLDEVRARISSGVIAEALASGRTIVTTSALDDPRFKKRGSVRRNRIEAVICAPIGDTSPLGVVYLQDRGEPGPFTREDALRLESFAKHLVVLAERLMAREDRSDAHDPTRILRVGLDATRLVGKSEVLAQVLRDIRLVAPREVTVLITGPTGTGKTEVARVIHDNSARRQQPFVALNCANFSDALIESELFGHERGAFTGADRRVLGKVAAASGGTLFLDEVGELPTASQAKLLKFIESREYYAVGATHPSRANVRLLAATNVDLEEAVRARRFRDDLYFRLRGFSLRVPSLAERREDIPELLRHFTRCTCEQEGIPTLMLSPGALRAAEAAEWTGNLRRLSTAAAEAVLRAHGDGLQVIEARHLFPVPTSSAPGVARRWPTLQEVMRANQAKYVQEVLDDLQWNISMAAERLDVVRSHVYNLIKAHGLKRAG